MGVESSVELPPQLNQITKWPRSRIESTLQFYHDGEYDFGIDFHVLMNITGLDIEDAAIVHKLHLKSDSGIVSAITVLISIICLGDVDNRNEVMRLEWIFELLDFNKNEQISQDELAILLLSVSSSFSFIHGIPVAQHPQDSTIIGLAKVIYEQLGKRHNTSLKKGEFTTWCKDKLFAKGITNCTSLLEVLKSGLNVVEESK